MKILYITTIGTTMNFFKALIRQLIVEGHTVDIACNQSESKVPSCYNMWGCKIFDISCSRTPLDKGNLLSINQIKKIVSNGQYDIVHCHTPIAAACTRIACKKFRRNGLKVIYTAHGFHFYKGAPKKNWLIYFPIEWICSFLTDCIITINSEDYRNSEKLLHSKYIKYIPGVGVNINRFKNVPESKKKIRKEIGVPDDCFLLISVGELNENKNHEVIIKALSKLNNPQIYYVIAGDGELKEYLIELSAEYQVADAVKLLGYRKDVEYLYHSADIFCFPSKREGLGLAAIEAMLAGIPIVTSNVHGINDYSQNGVTGYKCSPVNVEKLADAIKKLYDDPKLRSEIGRNNIEIASRYDSKKIVKMVVELYESFK